MKFLLYGWNGWIGQQIVELLKDYDYVCGNSRLENYNALEAEILSIKPTHIITTTGRTHGEIGDKKYTTIDYLEQKGKIKDNVRDNLFGPVVLALLCKKYNIHLTYLGTGCIFEYDKQHPFGVEQDGFTEDDRPNFFGSGYSVVKGYTDELLHLFDNVLNCRIRMPITNSPNPRNFITKITNYKKICSIPNSMTVLNDILPLMIDMAKKNITGTYNMTNPGLISHNQVLELYREIVDHNFKWENFSIEEQSQILAAGRSNNYLDTTKLSELYPQLTDIKTSIRNVMKNYKNELDKGCS